MRYLVVIVWLVALVGVLQGQVPQFDAQEAMGRIYDYLSEDDAVVDYEALQQLLMQLQAMPIDLNTTSPDELRKLPFLTDQQIENFFYYRYRTGGLKTLYELQLVDGLDPITIALMLPFVRISEVASSGLKQPESFKQLWQRGVHYFDTRVQTVVESQKGYRHSGGEYLGKPYDWLLRYRFRMGSRFYVALSAEQDAGEPFMPWNKYGFNSYHFYLQYRGNKWLESLVIGDYRAGFGQGLLFGSAFWAGKTGAILPSAMGERGLQRLTSLTEDDFLRGIGVTFKFNALRLSLLYSIRQRDALVTNDTFTSFKTDGYFRTALDYSKRFTVWQQVVGAHADYRYKYLTVGATLYGSLLDKSMLPSSEPYAYYYFRGKQQGAASVDYRVRLLQWQWWGEVAVSHRGAWATMHALEFYPSGHCSFTLLYRYYGKNYDLFFSRGFSDNGHIRNEQGLYLAMRLLPLSKWQLTAYVDMFHFPALRYGMDAPTVGYDLFLHNQWLLSSKFIIQARGRYRLRQEFIERALPVRELCNYSLSSWRLDLLYTDAHWHSLSSLSTNAAGYQNKPWYWGWLLVQEATWQLPLIALSANLRVEMFDAPHYATRFYFYDRNVPTLFYTPMLYGTGCRYYLLLRYRFKRNVTVAARVAQIHYFDGRQTIGSGGEAIAGCRRTDVAIYLLWQIFHSNP